MTLKQEKNRAKFLDSRLDDETAAKVEKWNLALLAVTLLHDADHIMQAHRWNYHIPLQLWIINLAVYVMLVFGLGTCVVMLLFGGLGDVLTRKYNKYILKGSTMLIITMGLMLMIKGIRLLCSIRGKGLLRVIRSFSFSQDKTARMM